MPYSAVCALADALAEWAEERPPADLTELKSNPCKAEWAVQCTGRMGRDPSQFDELKAKPCKAETLFAMAEWAETSARLLVQCMALVAAVD